MQRRRVPKTDPETDVDYRQDFLWQLIAIYLTGKINMKGAHEKRL